METKKRMTLHKVMEDVIRSSKSPMTSGQLWKKIVEKELWRSPNSNNLPSREQISARIENYNNIFVLSNKIVSLKQQKVCLFTRLTYNDRGWEVPIYHTWRKQDQKKKNIPYENQYGFGHEERLFNPRFNIDNFQYGYIRGLSRYHKHRFVDRVYLYTVDKADLERRVYYVGYIDNIVILNDKEKSEIREKVKKYDKTLFQEVSDIHGFSKIMENDPFFACIKFKIEDRRLLNELKFQPNFNLGKYKRFQPYELKEDIQDIFGAEDVTETDSNFVSGKASSKERHNRNYEQSTKVIKRLHTEIVDAFERYLSPKYSLANKNISIEKMRFSGNIADIITLDTPKAISIFEVKTSFQVRKNIREAFSQLLDYALHCPNFQINSLNIIAPGDVNKPNQAFINSIRDVLSFKLNYYQYNQDSKSFTRIP